MALLACGTTTAQAHDELYGWRGFYVGLQGAYSFINQDITFRVPNTNTGRADLGGLGGTILTGYRIPLGTERYRIGIELDGTVGDNRGPFNRYRFGADFLVNLRGTLGMHLRPDLLWFGTVGVGWVGINSATISTANSVVGGQALSDRRSAKTVVGGVVGTGLEWDMGRAIHLRGDYLYGSFDDHRADTSTSAGAAIAPVYHASATRSPSVASAGPLTGQPAIFQLSRPTDIGAPQRPASSRMNEMSRISSGSRSR